MTRLENHTFRYAITNDNFTIESQNYNDHYAFLTSGRYNSDRFYEIIIDTGASKHSTAGFQQFQAYQRIKPSLINKTKAGTVTVQFGIGKSTSIGSTLVDTPIGTIEFHILPVDTPFLLSLSDMDKLGIYYDNTKNLLVSPNSKFPVSRRFGHAFLIWGIFLESLISSSFYSNPCFLNETELRRLHRRFGHPSAERLYNLLSKSGHNDVPREYINQINKFCDHCQKHRGPPQRFKFKLQDDSAQFNHSIIVDVMYIDNHPVLHVVDEATNFQAARWLQNISSKHTWDAIRACWIDVYIGPPDYIVTDAGSNFTGKEFHQCATSMAVCVKNIPVEAHWSIGLVERYHALLRRSYEIIYQELKGESLSRDNILQMAVKSINDTAGPNGLIPTLLVFGAFPRMTQLDPPALSII